MKLGMLDERKNSNRVHPATSEKTMPILSMEDRSERHTGNYLNLAGKRK